jgi:hypothetical protein
MKLAFLDFGKPFVNRIAGEFTELAYTEDFASDPGKDRRDFDAVLRIPQNAALSGGQISAAGMPFSDNRFLFVLFQGHFENESQSKPSGRFFTQRRYLLANRNEVLNEFWAGNSPFFSLVETGFLNESDRYFLPTYEGRKGKVVSFQSSREKNHSCYLMSRNRLFQLCKRNPQSFLSTPYNNKENEILEKILNLSNFILAAWNESQKRIRIIGVTDFSDKIKIVDAVQRLVYHKLRWLRFSLDYVSQPAPSDPFSLLFVNTEEDIRNEGEYKDFYWNDASKNVACSPYFNGLCGENARKWQFSIVNKALLDDDCIDINQILELIEKVHNLKQSLKYVDSFWRLDESELRLLIRYEVAQNFLYANSYPMPFIKWLDLFSELRKTPNELSQILLDLFRQKKLEFASFDNIADLKNGEKNWEILRYAFESWDIELLHSLIRLLHDQETSANIPEEHIENYVDIYLARNSLDKQIYDFIKSWTNSIQQLSIFVFYVGLVGSIVWTEGQNLSYWLEKSKDVADKSDAFEYLSIPYNRRGDPNWKSSIIHDIEMVTGLSLDVNTREHLFNALEQHDYHEKKRVPSTRDVVDDYLDSHSVSVDDKTRPSIAFLVSELIKFVKEDNPVVSIETLSILETLDKLGALVPEIQNKLHKVQPPHVNSHKGENTSQESAWFSGFKQKISTSWHGLGTSINQLNKQLRPIYIMGIILFALWWMLTSPLLLPLWGRLAHFLPVMTANPTITITPAFVSTETPSATVAPPTPTAMLMPEISPTPTVVAIGEVIRAVDLPIGVLVYETITQDAQGKATYPLYYLSMQGSPTIINLPKEINLMIGNPPKPFPVTFAECVMGTSKEPYLMRSDDKYLTLSMAYPCDGDYKIAAKLFLKQDTLDVVESPVESPNAVASADLLFGGKNNITSVVFSSPYLSSKYVTFLANVDQNAYYWIIYDLTNTPKIYSFMGLDNLSIEIVSANNLPSRKENAYSIVSYKLIKNEAVLLFLTNGTKNQWLFLPFVEGTSEIDQERKVVSESDKLILDFSVRDDGAIALIFDENGQNYFQQCNLTITHQVECNTKPILLSKLKEITQLMWSPDGRQVAFSASLVDGGVVADEQGNLTQAICPNGCLFLGDVNEDGILVRLDWVKSITSGITHFWWTDPTIPNE